ncbi:ABC-type nitrate/sulfonate/bicarbonate transport systems periplasmic components-like protein [Paraburkholderia atlantica]|uniref:ABC-type nitrate/sulfonate/bicarbonate transport systems periplasmic components-like protein n=1 Tax=Paraburkholderia atlantica TaxID=2654982 RepID=D5WI77_PARAM|nr:ABC transporter substrate-binding protein [Paraburkholderia atlantica]ADG18172.1 ABC-type nitrate/sulfonate/bicarbonate transport systems periplasmic components-like protein [Paraburkholderia atlantica]
MSNRINVMWFVPLPLVMLTEQVPGATVIKAARNPSSDAQFEALVAGEVDAVVTAMDNVIGWNRRPGPQDFRVVAQVERTTPLTLVGAPDRKSVADLRGANLLVDAVDNGFVIALRAMLHEAGVDEIGYRLTPAGGVTERYEALLAGRGDATLLGQPFATQAAEAGLIQIASVQQAYPAFPGQGIVMRMGHPARERVGEWLCELERARRQVQDPDSLRPTDEGVAVLIAHRRLLGLPGGEDTHSDIVDTSLLETFLRKNQ